MGRIHIVAVTRDRGRVLVLQTAVGWLLPSIQADSRDTLLARLDELLTRLGANALVVHWAPIPHVDRTGGPSDERYCVLLVDGSGPSGVVAVDADDLLAADAALPDQRDAVATALDRMRAPRQDFDTATQVIALMEWASAAIAEHTNAITHSVHSYRRTRNDYVVGFKTTAGLMYVKAGRGRTRDEAPLCDLLQAIAPRQFPATLAVDREHDRWLYRAVPGALLSDLPLTAELVAETVRALARLQRQTLTTSTVRRHLAGRDVGAREILDEVDAMLRSLWRRHDDDASVAALFAGWDAFVDTTGTRTTGRLDALNLPRTLAFSDFWTANVVVRQDTADEERIGFIDVEHAYWTCPFLPLWRFRRNVDHHMRTSGAIRTVIEETFIAAWADVVRPTVMRSALDALPILGQLFSLLMASRDLDRLEQDIGTPLSAAYRARQLEPRIAALIAAGAP